MEATMTGNHALSRSIMGATQQINIKNRELQQPLKFRGRAYSVKISYDNTATVSYDKRSRKNSIANFFSFRSEQSRTAKRTEETNYLRKAIESKLERTPNQIKSLSRKLTNGSDLLTTLEQFSHNKATIQDVAKFKKQIFNLRKSVRIDRTKKIDKQKDILKELQKTNPDATIDPKVKINADMSVGSLTMHMMEGVKCSSESLLAIKQIRTLVNTEKGKDGIKGTDFFALAIYIEQSMAQQYFVSQQPNPGKFDAEKLHAMMQKTNSPEYKQIIGYMNSISDWVDGQKPTLPKDIEKYLL